MATKLKKIGDQWYRLEHSAGSAGVRCHGRGSWAFYLRDRQHRPYPGWENGREEFTVSRERAVRLASAMLDKML